MLDGWALIQINKSLMMHCVNYMHVHTHYYMLHWHVHVHVPRRLRH